MTGFLFSGSRDWEDAAKRAPKTEKHTEEDRQRPRHRTGAQVEGQTGTDREQQRDRQEG